MIYVKRPRDPWKARLTRWIAWHLPHQIVYWCLIRTMCNATQGEYDGESVTDVLVFDVLERWADNPQKGLV